VKESSVHQASTIIGDSMNISNEVLLWLSVFTAIVLFHRFLNFIIRDPASGSDNDRSRTEELKLRAE